MWDVTTTSLSADHIFGKTSRMKKSTNTAIIIASSSQSSSSSSTPSSSPAPRAKLVFLKRVLLGNFLQNGHHTNHTGLAKSRQPMAEPPAKEAATHRQRGTWAPQPDHSTPQHYKNWLSMHKWTWPTFHPGTATTRILCFSTIFASVMSVYHVVRKNHAIKGSSYVQLCPAMSSHLDWSPLPLAPPKHEDTAKAYRKRPKTWYLMASVMRIAATGRAMSFFSFAFLDTGFKAFLSRRCSESRLGELWTMAHSSYSLGPGWSTRVERLDMSGIFNGHTRSQPEFPKLFT